MIDTFNERNAKIVAGKVNGATFVSLGKEYKITPVRVREIYRKMMRISWYLQTKNITTTQKNSYNQILLLAAKYLNIQKGDLILLLAEEYNAK